MSGAQHTPGPWWTYETWQLGWGIVGHGRTKDEEHIVVVCDTADRVLQAVGETDDEFDARQKANARLIAAAPDMLAALKAVNKLISEAAMTGFNCHDGDWAERLFHSQQATSNAIRKAEPRS